MSQNRENNAYTQIKEKILNCELIPGDLLSEAFLSEMLGMSRTPIRAALKQLEFEGFILYHKNRGISIRETSAKEMTDILEMMVLFQHMAVEKVASGQAVFQLDTLTQLAEEAKTLRSSKSYAAYIEKTYQFNCCFLESTLNHHMMLTYKHSWERVISTSIYNKMIYPTAVPHKSQTTIDFIFQILDSIKAKDYTQTHSVLSNYLDYARSQISFYGRL